MPRIGRLEAGFLAIMVAAGLATAAYVTRNPAVQEAFLPPILWPLGAALAFDIITTLLRGGGMPPLAMPVRAAGVVLAMALYIALLGRV
jgi:L-asparaginase II